MEQHFGLEMRGEPDQYLILLPMKEGKKEPLKAYIKKIRLRNRQQRFDFIRPLFLAIFFLSEISTDHILKMFLFSPKNVNQMRKELFMREFYFFKASTWNFI